MAIYRGPGGAGDATNDATSQSILAAQSAQEAAASEAAAASSASSAATSATNAANSASTAATSATNASSSATAAASSASAAATSAASIDPADLVHISGTETIIGAKTFSTNPTFSGGTATGVPYLNGSKVLTTGSALQFDGSNLGLSVTPSAWASAKAISIANAGSVYADGVTSDWKTGIAANAYRSATATWKYQNSGVRATRIECDETNPFAIYTAPSGTAGNAISFTQAMTLDASGNLLVGATVINETASTGFRSNSNGQVSSTMAASTSGTNTYHVYSTGAGAYRFYVGMQGQIYCTNTTISSLSDRRYKENIRELDVGLDAVMALKPRIFDWKEGKGKDIKNDRGFIAQEFEQVFPDLIDEWKDPAPEGEEPYKSVRQDLIPVLVKAIQELKAELDATKAEVAALKGV